MRVLAVACRRLDALPADLTTVEADLTFLGFAGLIDPPRAEAAQAVAECRSAGITPVMITGDHPATALAIAKRLGIAADGSALMTGVELAALDDAGAGRAHPAARASTPASTRRRRSASSRRCRPPARSSP